MNTPMQLYTLVDALYDGAQLVEQTLYLTLGECRLRVRSNSAELLTKLEHYFSHVVAPASTADMEVIAIQRAAPQLGIAFKDWQREPGKRGRKDSYLDFPSGRLLHKVRTGMVFLQSETQRIAAGPCLRNDNQVINFINSQYMNWLQQRDWLICHAAALVRNGRALGIAGLSGGGKSTLMLQMLEDPAINYLTNDRLFIKPGGATTLATGIPKLPRINPGTIVHNPRLHGLIPAQQRTALLTMPKEALWELEDKYDVFIDEIYGPDRITASAPLAAFLVLNWQRGSTQPVKLERVELARRRDLLGAIMKTPGPFYQDTAGAFLQGPDPMNTQTYLHNLAHVAVYEASGGIDFTAMTRRLAALLSGDVT